MIADPFTKLHCCLRSDGGAAVLLAAEEYVRDCRTAPVWILGTGEHVSHTTMSEWPDFTVSPAAVSGRLAFERAGVRPDEIDVAELYDAFTYMTLVTLEDLGFCAKGEGGQFVEKGRLTVGGELPVNTDGGGLSAQHPGDAGPVPPGGGRTATARGGRGTPGQEDGRTPSRAGGGLRDGRVVLLVGDGGAGTVGAGGARTVGPVEAGAVGPGSGSACGPAASGPTQGAGVGVAEETGLAPGGCGRVQTEPRELRTWWTCAVRAAAG
jgi:Acetyl-CoA acetyltransferase